MLSFVYKITQFEGAIKNTDGCHVILVTLRESIARRLGVRWQPVIGRRGYRMRLIREYNAGDDDSYDTDINAPDNTLAHDLSLPAARSIVKHQLLILHDQRYHGVSVRWTACRLYSLSVVW